MTWCIYKHTSPSGKSYIGMTSKTPEQRWQNGAGYASDTQIGQAILKYGWDNFSHTIIEKDILSLEDAKDREKYWIQYYDSFRQGYNMTEGGDSIDPNSIRKKKVLCYETKEIFESSVEAANYFGVSYTNIGRSCRTGIKTCNKHFVYLEDYYEGWKPKEDGRTVSSKRQKVKCKETGQEFSSLREAAKQMNITPSLISRCCNGTLQTTHGYHFYFIERNEE